MSIPRLSFPPRFRLRLLASQSGAAMVEFALALPVLLVLYAGCYVLSDLIACQRKVSLATRELTELASRAPALEQADVATMLNGAAQVLAPYAAANAVLSVSAVQLTGSGQGQVLWSQALHGQAPVPGGLIALPAGLGPACGVVILGQVSYSYVPAIRLTANPAVPLADTQAMSPRYGHHIPLDGVVTPAPGCL